MIVPNMPTWLAYLGVYTFVFMGPACIVAGIIIAIFF